MIILTREEAQGAVTLVPEETDRVRVITTEDLILVMAETEMLITV